VPGVPFDPGKVDGRTLRRTGREPFATRIKPETHEALRRIAYNHRISIAEAVERAVAAFDKLQS
jgi:predicted HicB family RNase H-like nuclease